MLPKLKPNAKQPLTNAEVQARIADSEGEAILARARKSAQQTIVMADAELERSRREAEQTVLLAEADSQQRMLAGRGESQKIMQIGLSEAAVLLKKNRFLWRSAIVCFARGCSQTIEQPTTPRA